MIDMFLVFIAVVGIILLYGKSEEPEPYLMLKIIGLVILGVFRLEIGIVILPIGFLIFLLFARTLTTNGRVKKGAAYLGLLVFCLSLLLPFIENTIYEWPRKVEVQNTNFYSGSLVDELENIHKEVSDEYSDGAIDNFMMVISNEGKIEDFRMRITEHHGPREAQYRITLSEDNQEFIVKRKRFEREHNSGTHSYTEAKFFLAQIDLLEKSMLGDGSDFQTLRSTGMRQGYAATNTEKYIIDTAGKHKAENDNLPYEAIVVDVCEPGCGVYKHYLFDVLERYRNMTEETILGVARENSSDVNEWLNAHAGYAIAHETDGKHVLKKDGGSTEVTEKEYAKALNETPFVTIKKDEHMWQVTVEHPYGEAPHTLEFMMNVETREVASVHTR